MLPGMSQRVLVTGASGYLAGWCVAQLVHRGDHVRAGVRSEAREEDVRRAVRAAGADDAHLEFAHLDLTSDDGWHDAMSQIDGVLHVASPLTATRDAEQVIRPAVDGTLRVLRAARDAGVTRVVLTSSCGAVYYGQPERDRPFDESDWTVIGGGPMSAYVTSKALAERAAWDFIHDEGADLQLAVVNPAGIFGPALTASATSSLGLIRALLRGMPGVVDITLGIVDVRDVADLHLRALDAPHAAGQRYIAWGDGPISMLQVANELRAGLGDAGRRVPTRRIPAPLVRVLGWFSPQIADLVPLLGQRRTATSAKARRELDWRPRPWRKTVLDSATSLIQLEALG